MIVDRYYPYDFEDMMMFKRTKADDIVQEAYNKALLTIILPGMMSHAEVLGYTLTLGTKINQTISFSIKITSKDISEQELINGLVSVINASEVWCVKDDGTKTALEEESQNIYYLIISCGEGRAYLRFCFIDEEIEDKIWYTQMIPIK